MNNDLNRGRSPVRFHLRVAASSAIPLESHFEARVRSRLRRTSRDPGFVQYVSRPLPDLTRPTFENHETFAEAAQSLGIRVLPEGVGARPKELLPLYGAAVGAASMRIAVAPAATRLFNYLLIPDSTVDNIRAIRGSQDGAQAARRQLPILIDAVFTAMKGVGCLEDDDDIPHLFEDARLSRFNAVLKGMRQMRETVTSHLVALSEKAASFRPRSDDDEYSLHLHMGPEIAQWEALCRNELYVDHPRLSVEDQRFTLETLSGIDVVYSSENFVHRAISDAVIEELHQIRDPHLSVAMQKILSGGSFLRKGQPIPPTVNGKTVAERLELMLDVMAFREDFEVHASSPLGYKQPDPDRGVFEVRRHEREARNLCRRIRSVVPDLEPFTAPPVNLELRF